jgi:hypothetical protein
MTFKYVIRKRCTHHITTFYRNVSKKYKHTYSLDLMEKNVRDAYYAMFQIERTLPRREPTIPRWAGYHMAKAAIKREQCQIAFEHCRA